MAHRHRDAREVDLLGSRPMTRLSVAGLAAHVFFELAAGVGMPLASVVGPTPAAALWAVSSRGTWRAAATRPASSDPAFALLNAFALAAVLGHLSGWPRRRTRLGLPWLKECEGLGPDLMPAYNSILYFSGGTALIGLLGENRSSSRRLPVLLLSLTPVFVAAQHAEFRHLIQRARTRSG